MIRGERGSAVVLTLVFLPALLLALALAWDLGRLYAAKVSLKQACVLAVRAASMQLDQQALSAPQNPHPAVDPAQARSAFDQVLSANAQNCGQNCGRFFVSAPTVQAFAVVNPPQDAQRLKTQSSPYTFSYRGTSVSLNSAGVAAVVTARVEVGPLCALALGQKQVDITAVAAASPEMQR